MVTWAILLSHIIHVHLYGDSFMPEPLMYLGIAVFSFISLAHMVWNVAFELKQILQINLFTMTPKQLELQRMLAEADGPEREKKA